MENKTGNVIILFRGVIFCTIYIYTCYDFVTIIGRTEMCVKKNNSICHTSDLLYLMTPRGEGWSRKMGLIAVFGLLTPLVVLRPVTPSKHNFVGNPL